MMNSFPDDLLTLIFSHLDLRKKVKFESVSRRWKRILLDKSFRKLGTIDLNYLTGDNLNWELRLPYAIHSLVVGKGRMFEGTVFEFQNTHALISVMQTITSAQVLYLKHLEISRQISTTRHVEQIEIPDVRRLCELVSLCANVEVLIVDLSRVEVLANYHRMDVDLSQLMHLKVLKVDRVHFMNFQAPNLVELQYQDVRLDYRRDRTDFRQMLRTISSSIEVLNFTNVAFLPVFLLHDGAEDDDDEILQMPKLRKLTLRSNYLAAFTISLSESICLDSLVVHDRQYLNLINFDLSVHCLDCFDVNNPFRSEQCIVDQFITSAIRHPGRFCLLKELHIDVNQNDLIWNDLLDSISVLHIYCFKKFYFYNMANTEHVMTSNLLVLVDCSPESERIVVPKFVLDQKCLIDIIISRMRVVDIDFYFEFLRIDGDNQLAVLSNLYGALNDVGTLADKRRCDVKIKVNLVSVNVTNELHDLVSKIADHFRVFFTFGSC